MKKYEVKKFDNRTEYRFNDLLHRDDDLPAIEWNNGTKAWYQNGQLHRLDGPAYENKNGDKYWYQNNQKHRLDGPAIEYVNGYKGWYIEEEKYTEEEFNKKILEKIYTTRKLNDCIEYYYDGKLHRDNDLPAIEYIDGDKSWYQNGQRHRDDGPAIEYKDGTKVWYKNGELHRVDGPSIEWSNGNKSWYQNGLRHRIDGPAIEWLDGSKTWYIEGQEYTEEEFNKISFGKDEISQLKQEIVEKDELIKSYQKIINNIKNELKGE